MKKAVFLTAKASWNPAQKNEIQSHQMYGKFVVMGRTWIVCIDEQQIFRPKTNFWQRQFFGKKEDTLTDKSSASKVFWPKKKHESEKFSSAVFGGKKTLKIFWSWNRKNWRARWHSVQKFAFWYFLLESSTKSAKCWQKKQKNRKQKVKFCSSRAPKRLSTKVKFDFVGCFWKHFQKLIVKRHFSISFDNFRQNCQLLVFFFQIFACLMRITLQISADSRKFGNFRYLSVLHVQINAPDCGNWPLNFSLQFFLSSLLVKWYVRLYLCDG